MLGHAQLQLSAPDTQSEHDLAAGKSVCHFQRWQHAQQCCLQVTLHHGRLNILVICIRTFKHSVKPTLCTNCQE